MIKSDEAVFPLKLTANERKLLLAEPGSLEKSLQHKLDGASGRKPFLVTPNEMRSLVNCISDLVMHCDRKSKLTVLRAISEKVSTLLDIHGGQEPRTLSFADAQDNRLVLDHTLEIARAGADAIGVAEELRIKTKPLEDFRLSPPHLHVLLELHSLSKSAKSKLRKATPKLTVAEVGDLALAAAEEIPDAEPQQQVALLIVVHHLLDRLHGGIAAQAIPFSERGAPGRPMSASKELYQFKITLMNIEPPIWRRIQVQDGTLDELHEHIQTAMGWTNSHLHQFTINGQLYGDPELMNQDDYGDEFEIMDSTATLLSDIVPSGKKSFSFRYEYDFGDSWYHEIVFESRPPLKKKKYPLCLEGERACPPEDVGGRWGYETFLAAIEDPKHEDHEMYAEWAGDFDPEEFSAVQATKDMQEGLTGDRWKIEFR